MAHGCERPLVTTLTRTLVLLGRVEDPWPVAQRRYRYADGRRLGVAESDHDDPQRGSPLNGMSDFHVTFPLSQPRREG